MILEHAPIPLARVELATIPGLSRTRLPVASEGREILDL